MFMAPYGYTVKELKQVAQEALVPVRQHTREQHCGSSPFLLPA